MHSRHITLICPRVYVKDKFHFPFTNLSLGYIASYLRQHGHKVKIIDAITDDRARVIKIKSNGNVFHQSGIYDEELIKLIPLDTDFIGITTPSNPNAAIIHQLAPKIKNKFPCSPLILGGSYPSSLPEEALSSGADYVIKGEGEIPMLKLIEGNNPDQIKGLISKYNLDTACSNFAEIVQDLDSLPFPAYDLLPMDKYVSWPVGRKKKYKYAAIFSSRGCPYRCNFCVNNSVYNFGWRGRSAGNVLEEIRLLINKYKVREICFLDDNLIIDRQRIEELLEGLVQIKRDLNDDFSWWAFCGLRVDLLDYKLLAGMRDSGCSAILLPVENGDPRILEGMNRHINLEKIKEVVKDCQKLGIRAGADYIIGYPGETKESFLKSIEYFKALKEAGLYYVNIYKTKPFPNTALYEYCKKNDFLFKERIDHSYFLTSGSSTSRNRWVGVVTPDFSAQEINFRQAYAHRVLNPYNFYRERFPILKLFNQLPTRILKFSLLHKAAKPANNTRRE